MSEQELLEKMSVSVEAVLVKLGDQRQFFSWLLSNFDGNATEIAA